MDIKKVLDLFQTSARGPAIRRGGSPPQDILKDEHTPKNRQGERECLDKPEVEEHIEGFNGDGGKVARQAPGIGNGPAPDMPFKLPSARPATILRSTAASRRAYRDFSRTARTRAT